MKYQIVTIFLTFFTAVTAEDDGRKSVTMEQALKLGPDKLTAVVGGSEAGQDIAYQLYASAMRLKTENRLAAKDLQLVTDLDWVRRTTGDCIDGFCRMAYALNGGGTMYSHAEARNDVALEVFLANFSKYPTTSGKGDAATVKRMEELVQFVSNLEITAEIKADASKEMIEAFLKFRAETVETLMTLKVVCLESEPARSKALGTFVISQAKWIEFPAKGEKKDGADQ